MTDTCVSDRIHGPVLTLPEELTIYAVTGLRSDWLGWVAQQTDRVEIDASAVMQIDAAGVQLLAALLRALDAQAIAWQLRAQAGALPEALQTLGLSHWLASGT